MLAWVVIDRRHLWQSPQSRFIRALPLQSSPLNFQLLTFNLPLFSVPTFQPSSLPACKPSESFSCSTYGSPRKYCKQKTYGLSKPFRCNTYKKHGDGVGSHQNFQLSTQPSSSPKSLPYNPFADPHPLSLYPAIFYKKGGGKSASPVPFFHQSPVTDHESQFPTSSILWIAL